MIRWGAAVIGLGLASASHAETCLTPTLERAFPNATEVRTRFADIPTPAFPGLWQEGFISGLFYQIWSNDEAVLRAAPSSRDWAIEMACTDGEASCRQSVQGTPPASAFEVAGEIEACLTDTRYAGPQARDPEPEPQPEPAPEPEPCGLAAIEVSDNIGLTLQRLIVAAGGDPGPLDGFPGSQTTAGLIAVLGEEAGALSNEAAVAALDAALCETAQ